MIIFWFLSISPFCAFQSDWQLDKLGSFLTQVPLPAMRACSMEGVREQSGDDVSQLCQLKRLSRTPGSFSFSFFSLVHLTIILSFRITVEAVSADWICVAHGSTAAKIPHPGMNCEIILSTTSVIGKMGTNHMLNTAFFSLASLNCISYLSDKMFLSIVSCFCFLFIWLVLIIRITT